MLLLLSRSTLYIAFSKCIVFWVLHKTKTRPMIKITKVSPKRVEYLGKITENIKDELIEEGQKEVNYSKLIKLWVTHWTVHVTCFQKVIDDYTVLFKSGRNNFFNFEPICLPLIYTVVIKVLEDYLLDGDHRDPVFFRKTKIVGYQKKINSPAFYFGHHVF